MLLVLECMQLRSSGPAWSACFLEVEAAMQGQVLRVARRQVRTYAGNKGCGHTFYVIGPDGSPLDRQRLTAVCSQVPPSLILNKLHNACLPTAFAAGWVLLHVLCTPLLKAKPACKTACLALLMPSHLSSICSGASAL